eukprot:NODE_12_length_54577_cov_0.384100.p13 type:complete len:366 gc:universal NODE_12_length_54577_cov_0.384100:34992-36089(+)
MEATDDKMPSLVHILPNISELNCFKEKCSTLQPYFDQLDEFMTCNVLKELESHFAITFITVGNVDANIGIVVSVKEDNIVIRDKVPRLKNVSCALPIGIVQNDVKLFNHRCDMKFDAGQDKTLRPGCKYFTLESTSKEYCGASIGLYLKIDGKAVGLSTGHSFRNGTDKIEHLRLDIGSLQLKKFEQRLKNEDLIAIGVNPGLAYSVADCSLIQIKDADCVNEFTCNIATSGVEFPVKFTEISENFDLKKEVNYFIITGDRKELCELVTYGKVYIWNGTIDGDAKYTREFVLRYKKHHDHYNVAEGESITKNVPGDCGNVVFHFDDNGNAVVDGMFIGTDLFSNFAIFSTTLWIKKNLKTPMVLL